MIFTNYNHKNDLNVLQQSKVKAEGLQNAVNDYEKKYYILDNKLKSLMKELKSNQMIAGTVDVEGEGVSITLTDKKDASVGLGVVHDRDLTCIIYQMANTGVDAISVNGERIIASSGITASKNDMTLSINENKYNGPFTIKAIGKSDKLENSLRSNDYIKYRQLDGIQVKIEKEERLFIPKYKGNLSTKYAQPVLSGEN
jgi:uncharacterized protein YlxW (UPF0749 family)